MSESRLGGTPRVFVRGTPRNFAVIALITVIGLGAAAFQRSGAVGDEPRKEIDRAAMHHAEELSEAFHNAAEVALPSVVTIHSKTKARTVANNGRNRRNERNDRNAPGENPFKGTPLEDFFGNQGRMEDFFQSPTPDMPRREGMGSGVIIDRSGIVLTNNHVVEGADEVVVHLADGREFKGKNIKTDEHTDLAVIRIEGAGSLPAAKLGDSDKLRVGDWVIAIGNPFGQEQSVSAGIISGVGRDLIGGGGPTGRRTKYIQTDAAINPGNSGGPLVNLYGEVIGINTAIATNTGSFNGLGFAIPANVAKWVVAQLIDKGTVQRAYLGIGIGEVTPDLAKQFGVRQGEGVLVSEVHPKTPAADAGFKDGDVIIKFGGQKVRNTRELQELVERSPLESKQDVEILRDGRTQTLHVTAKPLPDGFEPRQSDNRPKKELKEESLDYSDKDLGVTVADLPAKRAAEMGLDGYSGVLVTDVDQSKPAYDHGLREGMLIMKVGKKPVTNVEEFHSAMKVESLKEGVMLHVRSRVGGGFGNHFVVIKE